MPNNGGGRRLNQCMRITLEDSNDNWPSAFEQEREHLQRTLGTLIIAIEHIGSTSVPGLAAKPVVDVQVGVTSLEGFKQAKGLDMMQEAGYQYLPEFETMAPFRRLFIREVNGVRQSNIHLVAIDHPWFQRHLIFRNYLRISPESCARYEGVKRELAKLEWEKTPDYADAKTTVVQAIEEEAFEHFDFDEEYRAWIRTSRV